MKRTITIEFWNDEKREFTEQEQAVLEKAGIERATEMINEGYIAGELIEEINGKTYRGWFDYKEASQ